MRHSFSSVCNNNAECRVPDPVMRLRVDAVPYCCASYLLRESESVEKNAVIRLVPVSETVLFAVKLFQKQLFAVSQQTGKSR